MTGGGGGGFGGGGMLPGLPWFISAACMASSRMSAIEGIGCRFSSLSESISCI